MVSNFVQHAISKRKIVYQMCFFSTISSSTLLNTYNRNYDVFWFSHKFRFVPMTTPRRLCVKQLNFVTWFALFAIRPEWTGEKHHAKHIRYWDDRMKDEVYLRLFMKLTVIIFMIDDLIMMVENSMYQYFTIKYRLIAFSLHIKHFNAVCMWMCVCVCVFPWEFEQHIKMK